MAESELKLTPDKRCCCSRNSFWQHERKTIIGLCACSRERERERESERKREREGERERQRERRNERVRET